MVRHLFSSAAVLFAAGTASAQYPVYCPPPYYHPPLPVVVCCPPLACVPCPPAVGVIGSATPKTSGDQKTPQIIPERMPEKESPRKETKAEPPTAPREFATPKPAEPTPEPKPDVTPVGGNVPPIPPPAVPPTPAPKPKDPEPPAAKPSLPAFEFTPPPAELPKATDTLPPLPIPPAKTDTPKAEEKVKAPGSLPSFDIDFPKGPPAQPVEANKPVVAKSSPLSGGREVAFDVYPVDGPAPASPAAKRTIGFINKSDRDLLLTIDGKMVTLPSKNVLRAELPAAVRWQVGGGEERDLKVPPTAPGVDVVIRK